MNKRFSWIVLLASGAFFVFIVGLTGYRIEAARRHNTMDARETAAALAAKVSSLADTTGSIQSPLFKSAMRDVFEGEPRLLLLAVHSPQDGMLYLVTRNRSLLKDPAQVTPDWRGTPTYVVSRGSEVLVSSHLPGTHGEATMDSLFVTMGREDLYPVVRDDLYFFLAFLLVCGVVILIVMSVEPEGDAEGGRGAGRGTARGTPSAASAWPGHAEPARPRPASEARAQPAAAPAGAAPSSGAAPAASAPVQPAPSAGGGSATDALVSPRTGLVWGEFLEQRLRTELERASSSDQDISLARLKIDEPFADGRLPVAYVEIARQLKQFFPLHDLIFETGKDSYAMILPDVDVDAAVRQMEELRGRLAAQEVEGRTRTLSIGVSSRGGRLIDEDVLRDEAQVALAKASREGGNQVVGFRADPAKFRQKLA